jgi:outer membrane protein assembly factor BamA
VHELSEKTNSLLSTGLFEAVDSNLTIKALESGRFQAEVQINVKEKQIPTIETAAYVKSGTTSEVGAEFKAALRNPIGFGEVLKASTVASQTGREYTCQLSIPNVGPRRMNMNMIARSGVESQAYYTSFRQQINAVSVELRSRDDKHQFVYEYALRDEVPVSLSDIARNQGQDGKDDKSKPWDIFSLASLPASAVTVHTAAASLKTALRYNCTLLDTRDHPAAPSTGSYLQSSVEVAAPPGKPLHLFLCS